MTSNISCHLSGKIYLDWVFFQNLSLNSFTHVAYHNYHSTCMDIVLSYSTMNTTHTESNWMLLKRRTDNGTESGSKRKTKKYNTTFNFII